MEHCSHIWGTSTFISLLNRVESKAICLISDPSLTTTLNPLSLSCKVASLSISIAITLVAALMNWLPTIYVQWFGHIPQVRRNLSTIIVWKFPTQELTGSVSFLPSTCCLWNSLRLFSQLPSTFIPSKGGSITTLGTRCNDFLCLFYFYLFFSTYVL